MFEKVRLKRENTNEWYVIVPQSSKAAADGPFALFAVKTRYVSDSNKIRISTIIIYDFTFQAVLSIFSKIISKMPPSPKKHEEIKVKTPFDSKAMKVLWQIRMSRKKRNLDIHRARSFCSITRF